MAHYGRREGGPGGEGGIARAALLSHSGETLLTSAGHEEIN